MSDKEKLELDRNEDPMSYSTGMPPDWRFGGANLANSSVGGLVSMGNSMNVSRGDLIGSSSCSSASMVDSFGPNFWDHPTTNSQNMGFCDINVHNNGSSLNTTGIRKDGFGTIEMGWNPANSMLKGDGFLPNGPGGVFPQSLSQFPTDSGFIERAARFSCFSGGSFGDVVNNSYGIPQSMMGVYAAGTMHGSTRDALAAGHGLKSAATGGQSQENDLNAVEATKAMSPSIEHLAITKGSPMKNDKRSDSHEGKQALVRPANDSDRGESSDDGGGQDDSPMVEGTSGGEPSLKGLNSKKRKRSGQVYGCDLESCILLYV